MLNVTEIVCLQDERTRAWHDSRPSFERESETFRDAVEQQHYANFQLWHEEDKARIPGAPDSEIAAVKRTIDKMNQQRNDLMEQCDLLALVELAKSGLPNVRAPLHTESIGLILDRLSILSLKVYHTRIEVERENAPAGHAERNRERLATLLEQRHDLASALDTLWAEVLAGRRRFKVYRQLKMYNEASLNPLIYNATKRG
jgi:hypothetical protein